MENDDALFEGDTVRMIVGGPLMTVLAVDAEHCCCFWFDDQGRLAHGDFEREVLRFVRPAQRLIPNGEAFWRRRQAAMRVASNAGVRVRATQPAFPAASASQ